MGQLKVYAAEHEAGLESFLSKSVAKVIAPIRVRPADDFDSLMASLKQSKAEAMSVKDLIGIDQPDLALLDSILVSTGWNKNDDIFLPAETWAARETPAHKPINIGHDEETIVGHMVKSLAVDKSGAELVIPEGGEFPLDFDIEVWGVLYRALPAIAEKVAGIIASAQRSELFVSMETWFDDFAYGFQKPGSSVTHVVVRGEETAFLTKHLRVYGGDGQYQGYRVGRVLLGLNFAGVGFVENPANPESVIKQVAKVAAATAFETSDLSQLRGGAGSMADKDSNVVSAEELQGKLSETTKALETKTAEAVAANKALESLKAQKLDEKVAALTAQVSEKDEAIKALDAAKAGLQTKLDEATKRAQDAEAELASIRKAAKARERLAKLAEVKAITDEQAAFAELAEMSDDTFGLVLKYAGSSANAGETKPAPEQKPAAQGTEKPAPTATAKPEDRQAEEATAALANAQPEDEPDFQGGDTNVAQTVATIAKATAECLLGRGKTKK